MVKMFTQCSVILSECLVGLDPEVLCDVRLKSRIRTEGLLAARKLVVTCASVPMLNYALAVTWI